MTNTKKGGNIRRMRTMENKTELKKMPKEKSNKKKMCQNRNNVNSISNNYSNHNNISIGNNKLHIQWGNTRQNRASSKNA